MGVIHRLALLFLLVSTIPETACQSLPDHPRVFVQSEDVGSIQEKLTSEPFAQLWSDIEKDSSALSLAVQYLLNQEEETGKQAIRRGLALVKNGKDARKIYNPLLIGACVYDWCYPLLSEKQKQQFIEEFIRMAQLHEPGFPARPDVQAVVGHNSEGWVLSGQLPAGLAIHDEAPIMFEAAETLVRERFVPVRNFHYQAHMHHQGDSYISSRFAHDILASWLFRRAGLEALFSSDQQWVPYQLLYHLRPDGMQLRSGDTFDDRGRDRGKRLIALLTGSYYHDPYLLTFADMELFAAKTIEDKIFELLFRPAQADKKPLSDLPLTKYFPEPMGEMVARSGWDMGVDSDDAIVQMRIGNYFFGNHQRKDFGTFQVYYKGALAISSGVYGGEDRRAEYGSEHWAKYYHQTLSTNGLLIRSPTRSYNKTRKYETANSGGQYWPNDGRDHPDDLTELLDPDNGYQMGEVTARGFGPDTLHPFYSYIQGDITDAYRPEDVRQVTRTMITLQTGNPVSPCLLVVYDQVTSTQEQAHKTWLLHSIQEPTVDGKIIRVVRDEKHYRGRASYDGALTVTSLLPREADIQKIGGEEEAFWVAEARTNFKATKKREGVEAGRWRVEISPTKPATHHEFLTVLQVHDGSRPRVEEVSLIEDGSLVGVAAGPWQVYCYRQGSRLNTATLSVPAGEPKHILVEGLPPGIWRVTRAGKEEIVQRTVSSQDKSLYLYVPAGDYQLLQLGEKAVRDSERD